jgi:hypothetical protein
MYCINSSNLNTHIIFTLLLDFSSRTLSTPKFRRALNLAEVVMRLM